LSSVSICRLNVVQLLWVSPGMVAVGDCSWNGYSSLILSYILLIGILWCGCGFIPGVCSWSSQRSSDIASMSGPFFSGVLGILGTSGFYDSVGLCNGRRCLRRWREFCSPSRSYLKSTDRQRCLSKLLYEMYLSFYRLNGGISTGKPTLIKNLAKAWDKCSL